MRTGGADGIVRSECESPSTRSARGQGQEPTDVPAQVKQTFASSPPVCAIQARNGLDVPPALGRVPSLLRKMCPGQVTEP